MILQKSSFLHWNTENICEIWPPLIYNKDILHDTFVLSSLQNRGVLISYSSHSFILPFLRSFCSQKSGWGHCQLRPLPWVFMESSRYQLLLSVNKERWTCLKYVVDVFNDISFIIQVFLSPQLSTAHSILSERPEHSRDSALQSWEECTWRAHCAKVHVFLCL